MFDINQFTTLSELKKHFKKLLIDLGTWQQEMISTNEKIDLTLRRMMYRNLKKKNLSYEKELITKIEIESEIERYLMLWRAKNPRNKELNSLFKECSQIEEFLDLVKSKNNSSFFDSIIKSNLDWTLTIATLMSETENYRIVHLNKSVDASVFDSSLKEGTKPLRKCTFILIVKNSLDINSITIEELCHPEQYTENYKKGNFVLYDILPEGLVTNLGIKYYPDLEKKFGLKTKPNYLKEERILPNVYGLPDHVKEELIFMEFKKAYQSEKDKCFTKQPK